MRDHRHRNQDRRDQDDVLRDLGPRHGAHAAQKRAHQNARESAENADGEIHADKARRDQPDALDLRDQIDERAQDRRQRREAAHRVARKTRAEKIGNRVARELAHIRREQKRDEAIAARPAHQIRETVISGRIDRPGQPDERRRRKPVGRGRHAVERGRHAPPRHVVFDQIGRARQHADHRIHRDRHEQEHIADPHAGAARALDAPHHIDEQQEAERVERVGADQPVRELHRLSVRCARGLAFVPRWHACCAGIRIECALQAAVGALHQHDIHDDQREIDQDRALRAEVERQPEAADAHLRQRRRASAATTNDTTKPRAISVAISARLKRQYLPMRARHRRRDRGRFGRGIERSVRGVVRRGHAPMYQKATGQAIGIVRAVAFNSVAHVAEALRRIKSASFDALLPLTPIQRDAQSDSPS